MTNHQSEKQPSATFRTRVFHAGIWSLGLQAADRILGLLRTVLLARLLSPDDIGLFAVAAMALNLLETFSRTGFRSALIHKQGVVRRDLDVAWTVHVIRGFIRASILWLAAPYIAEFYDAPAAAALVRTISLLLIFHGFSNIGTVYFRKELQYQKLFLLEFGGKITDLATVVVAALILGNAWALAYGLVARFFFQLVFSYLIHPFRPRPCLNVQALRPLVNFGVWMSLTGIVIFIGRQTAGAVLGKVVTITALGFYQMAFMITQAAILEPVMAVTSVAFPALSRLQQNPDRFRHSCLLVIGLSAAVVMPLSTVVALAADDIALTLLGAAWLPVVPLLRVLALAGMMISMAALGDPIFLSSGQPGHMFKVYLGRAICVLMTIYPLTLYAGAVGSAFSALVGGCGMLAVSVYYIRRIISFQPKVIVGLLLPPLLACGGLILSWELTSVLLSASDISVLSIPVAALGIKLLLGVCAFALVYHFSQALNPTGIDFKAFWAVFWGKKDFRGNAYKGMN